MNDNHPAQALYDGDSDHLPYLSMARYLIEQYGTHHWKHDCNDPDYVLSEMQLCGHLAVETSCTFSREVKERWIAGVLGVSPVFLYNDPRLSL